MTTCPNKSHPDWKALAALVSEKEAYRRYVSNNFEIPQPQNVTTSNTLSYLDHLFVEVNTPTSEETKVAQEKRVAEIKNWWSKTFGVELDTNTEDLLFNKGQWAAGIFNSALVRISKTSTKGVEYHEGFHVATQLYLNEDERNALYKEAKEKYGENYTNDELEELLADQFMEYMLRKEKVVPEEKGIIRKLFDALLNWINNILPVRSQIDTVFKRIESGEFKYQPSEEAVKFANKVGLNKTVISREVDKEVQTLLGNMLIEEIEHVKAAGIDPTVMDWVKGTVDFKNNIKTKLEQKKEQVESERKKQNIQTVLDNFDHFYRNAKRYVEAQFQVQVLDDLDLNSLIEQDKNWDDKKLLKQNSKENTSYAVKKAIMTTPKLRSSQVLLDKKGNPVYLTDQNTFLGFSTFLDYEQVFPFIRRHMANANSPEEMSRRLETLAGVDPSLVVLSNKLKSDSQFRAAWYSTFSMQVPIVNVVLKEFNNLRNDVGNKSIRPDYALADEWKDSIVRLVEEKQNNSDEIKAASKNLEDIYKNADSTIVEKIDAVSTLASTLGINLPSNIIRLVTKNPEYQKYLNSSSEANTLNRIFTENLNKIKEIVQGSKEAKEVFKDGTLTAVVNSIAQYVASVQYDITDDSFLNINGDIQFGHIKPNFLSEFFKDIENYNNINTTHNDREAAKTRILEKFTELAQDPSMRHSNWIWRFISASDKSNPETYKLRYIDAKYGKLAISEFKYALVGGFKDNITQDGLEYTGMSTSDWVTFCLTQYVEREKDKNYCWIPVPIQSDSGNIYMLRVPRFELEYEQTEDGKVNINKVNTNSALFNALDNTTYQEIARIQQAVEEVFNVNEAGVLSVKDDANTNPNLQLNVHFKLDKEGNRIFLDKGKPVGNVFYFHNMKVRNETPDKSATRFTISEEGNQKSLGKEITLNHVKVGDKTFNEVIWAGLYNQTTHGSLIREFTKAFAYQQITDLQNLINPIKERIEGIKEVGRYPEDVKRLAWEYALNFYLHTVEMNNTMLGTLDEFKLTTVEGAHVTNLFDYSDANKRAKQITSPGQNGDVSETGMGATFTGVTIADVILPSKEYDNMVRMVASLLQGKKAKYDITSIKKGGKTELEKQIAKIVNAYLKTNTTDAQGYITIDRYEKILKGYGRNIGLYPELIRKIKQQFIELRDTGKVTTKLNFDELSVLLEPLKGFYFNRSYNADAGRIVSNQIKYSTVPLIPQLVAGTQLEDLAMVMHEKNIDEVFYQSAHKVGITTVDRIHDDEGNLIPEKLQNLNVRNYENRQWRIQQDNPSHILDHKQRLGTQIAKLLIANLDDSNAIYKLGDTTKTGKELRNHYFKLLTSNITESASALLDKLGARETDEGSIVIDDWSNIQELLVSEIRKRGLSDNYIQAVELIDKETGEFNLPLFVNTLSDKFESILLAQFDKNVIQQKLPGAIAVLFSSAFTESKTLSDVDAGGIEWSKEKADSKTLRFFPLESNNQVGVCEVLLPRTSKLFANEDGMLTIDEINEQDPELLQMVGYRIPSEAKYSTIIFKVVGFLPSESGSTIVVPQEVITQSGMDFDIDKMYILRKNIETYEEEGKDGLTETKLRTTKYLDNLDDQYEYYLENSDELRDVRKEYGKKIAKANQTKYASRKIQESKLRKLLESTDLSEAGFKELRQEQFDLIEEHNDLKKEREFLKDEYKVLRLRVELEGTETIREKAKEVSNRINAINLRTKEIKLAKKDIAAKLPAEAVERAKEKKAKFAQYSKVVADLYAERDAVLQAALPLKEFKKRSEEQRNIAEARQNRIVDIYSSILTNPFHYIETITPATFKEMSEVRDEIEQIYEKGSLIHPTTFSGQLKFREKNVDGRNLKGLAANANQFTPIAQNTKMYLRNDLGIKQKYLVDKKQAKELIKKFGKEAVIEQGEDYIIINHTKLGWNADNSYTNLQNRYITAEVSKVLSNVLDLVKDPLPPNINTFTFYPYITALMTGMDVRTATLLINQPVIRDMAKTRLESESIFNNNTENINQVVSAIKEKYQQRLYKARKLLDPNNADKFIEKQLEEGFWFIRRNADGKKKGTKELLGYDPDSEVYFSEQDYIDLLKVDAKTVEGFVPKGKTKAEIEEFVDFLTKQLYLLETFNKSYWKAGEAVNDAIKVLGTDRMSVGPNLTSVTTLEERKEAVRQGDLTEEGANPRVLIDGKDIISQIFTEDIDKSAYPPINAYYQKAFKLAFETFNKSFIKHSPASKHFKNLIRFKVNGEKGRPLSDAQIKRVDNFLKAVMISNLPYFEYANKERILGLGVDKNYDTDMTIEEFNQLSASNKLAVMKLKMADQLRKDTLHVLNYLEPKLNPELVEKNKYHAIDFKNTTGGGLTDDAVISSFEEMLDSKDPFVKSLAEDLLAYNFFTAQFNFGYRSFAKVIPTTSLVERGVREHLEEAKAAMLNNTLYFQDMLQTFMQNYSYDKGFVPVAIVGKETNNMMFPKQSDGSITVGEKFMRKFPNLDRDYIRVVRYETVKGVREKVFDVLYKRSTNGRNVDSIVVGAGEEQESKKQIVYLPISRKGASGVMEISADEESIFKENNTSDLEFKDIAVKGVNIISDSSDALAAALTNPTTIAKRKGKIKNDYPVEVRGKKYVDAEAAYKALKVNDSTLAKQGKIDPKNNQIMVEILTAKLQQHPSLVSAITQRGGVEFLEESSHIGYGNRFEGRGLESAFIRNLTQAYKNVSGGNRLSLVEPMNYLMPKSETILKTDTSTLAAIIAGNRTSTTRGYWHNVVKGELKSPTELVGKVLRFEDKQGNGVWVEIKSVHKITEEDRKNPEFLAQWEQSEGWTKEHLLRETKVGEYQVKFENRTELQKQKQSLRGLPETETQLNEKVAKLQAAFEKVGVKVDVVRDDTVEELGFVENKDGTITITFNPTKVKSDSAFHEFGHVYVDLLGFNHPLIQRGIEQLRGTELWNQIAEIYPELNEEQLAKEVLTTAIGLKADELFREEQQVKDWKYWLNRLFRFIAEKLGFSDPNVAKQLAKELVSGNLREDLTGEVSYYKQKQKDIKTTKDLKWGNGIMKEIVTDLHRALYAYGEALKGEKTKHIKEVIEKVMVADELTALTNYAEATLESVSSLETQVRLYENITYDAYKTFTDAEKESFNDFIRAMGDLLNHFVKVREFDYLEVDDTENEDKTKELRRVKQIVINSLKDLEKRVSTLDNQYRKLLKVTTTTLLDKSSNPLFADNTTKTKDKFFAPQDDLTWTQLWLDAMGDANHPILANAAKIYDYAIDRYRLKKIAMMKEWEKMFKSIPDGFTQEDFFEKDSAGAKTGKLVREIDYEAFDAAKAAEVARLNSYWENNQLKLIQQYDSKEEYVAQLIGKWLAKNTEKVPNYQDIIDEKRDNFTAKEFEAWLERNTVNVETETGIKTYYKGELARPKVDKYKSAAFEKIKSNPKALEFYNYLRGTFAYLTDHLKSSIVDYDYLPAIPVTDPNDPDALKNELLAAIGWKKGDNTKESVLTNRAGEEVQFIPMRFIYKLNQQEYREILPEDDEDTRRAKNIENASIKEANKRAHAESISYDLNQIMELFVDAALKHKYKTQIESELVNYREQLLHSKMLKKNGIGQVVYDAVVARTWGESHPQVESAERSNALKRYDKWLKMVFYEDFELDEGMLQKAARVLQNYSSIRGLGLNMLAGVNNVIYGSLMINSERIAGQFFSKDSWRKAYNDYFSKVFSYHNDVKEGKPSSKQSALMMLFDVLQSQDELAGNEGGEGKSILQKALMARNWLFFQQHIGEHMMQNSALLSMLMEHKIVDGKVMNLKDFTRSKLKEIKPGDPLVNIDVELNKEARKKAKEDFAKYPSLYDSYKFNEATNELTIEGLSDEEFSRFRRKVIGVNQYLHGIYNKEDAGTIQHYALGRLAMQFRKWMRPGWSKRFGSRFGESFWNERREMRDEGMYVTTWNFLTNPIQKGIKEVRSDESIQMSKFIKTVMEDYKDMITNLEVHWESLDETQKANIVRTMVEFSQLIGIVTLGMILRGLKGSADDDEKSFINKLLYQQDRTYLELVTYTPFPGWTNESRKLLRTPAATFTVFESLVKIAQDLFNYPFGTEKDREFRSGIYYGESKLKVHTINLIPIYNQYWRWIHLDKQSKYYKLY